MTSTAAAAAGATLATAAMVAAAMLMNGRRDRSINTTDGAGDEKWQ